MIRLNVDMRGMPVDVLEWDGSVKELQDFSPDEYLGMDEDGSARTETAREGIERVVRLGDIVVRPAGRTDVSPLMFFREHWWTTALGLLDNA